MNNVYLDIMCPNYELQRVNYLQEIYKERYHEELPSDVERIIKRLVLCSKMNREFDAVNEVLRLKFKLEICPSGVSKVNPSELVRMFLALNRLFSISDYIWICPNCKKLFFKTKDESAFCSKFCLKEYEKR